MPNHLIRRLAILGAIALMAILFIQGYWVRQTYLLKDSEFHQTVSIALYDVALKLAEFNESELPKENLIQRQSSNVYAVNINDVIDPNVLEDYLKRMFTERALNTDFEYAVYDCLSKEMVYGNYCKMTDFKETKVNSELIPKFDDLIYYFVIRFPSRSSWLVGQMWQNVVFGIATLLVLAFFVYSMWLVLHQKRLSELQKDFINNMTHEFKTPISSIKIAINSLSTNSYIKEDPRLARFTSIIADQNDRLNLQVEKVLNLAKLEDDNFKLNLEVFDLIPIVEQIITNQSIKSSDPDKCDIQFISSVASAKIKADKLHFTNTVYNLIDNAIKYSRDTHQIKVKLIEEPNYYALSFKDYGIGIAKENIPKLFTKFYRVPTGNLHDVKGFGLGLFYVKNIADSHGWQILLKSELGKGSEFTIRINKVYE